MPLYFGDRLRVVNPRGRIGVVTLWSKPDYVLARFREAGVDLTPENSPVAVFGTLYGNGLREMLRNLLYNPQIRVLLLCGHDRSGSQQELLNFFELGVEPVTFGPARYRPVPGMAEIFTCRIRETNRLLDSVVLPEAFARPPRLVPLGDPKEEDTLARIAGFFRDYQEEPLEEAQRIKLPLPEVEIQYFPGNPRGHQVVAPSPLEAWLEIIFRLLRFGRRVTLKKGERLELQNLKVVVEKPKADPRSRLQEFHLDLKDLRRYQTEIIRSQITRELKLRPTKASLKGQARLPSWLELRPDEAYNYGNRLRSHFQLDGLHALANRLRKDPEDRKAYFTLWDNSLDLRGASGQPCFVSLFFRKFQDRLTMTATFRTHNALDGWLMNFYGLLAIQKWVANRVKILPGPITVFSHSITLDPRELDRALLVAAKRRWRMQLDPMGYFRVSVDGREILVEHRFEEVTLKEYRGRTALSLQHQLARDLALSDINHALYLGRQLAKAELAIKEGRDFVQD